MSLLRIKNKPARQLWLTSQGLGISPTGPLDLLALIKQLGFVQLDAIQVVARAHHHILWSRNQNYREPMLDQLLAKDRAIFEHFTHDASVIPMDFLPYWQRQFLRKKAHLDRPRSVKRLPDQAAREAIKARIGREGPLSTHAFDTQIVGEKKMWSRPPHKLGLDYLWYTGELATSHRVNFTKYYDLAEHVFPAALRALEISDAAQIDWLCQAALDRMGFSLPSEVQQFWDAVSPAEMKDWIARSQAMLQTVSIETASGQWFQAIAPADIEARLANMRPATSRLRIVNPFDPAIRDRKRLQRLFGFEYRVEMFVPAAKRVWGYYVFPILEGAQFVGRIEVKGDRQQSVLQVVNFWPEPGVTWSDSRYKKLALELERMRQFIGVKDVEWTREGR